MKDPSFQRENAPSSSSLLLLQINPPPPHFHSHRRLAFHLQLKIISSPSFPLPRKRHRRKKSYKKSKKQNYYSLSPGPLNLQYRCGFSSPPLPLFSDWSLPLLSLLLLLFFFPSAVTQEGRPSQEGERESVSPASASSPLD